MSAANIPVDKLELLVDKIFLLTWWIRLGVFEKKKTKDLVCKIRILGGVILKNSFFMF